MARIHIEPGRIRVSKAGYDPRTATLDQMLLTSDLLSDQAVIDGVAAFGSGNSVSVALPSLYSTYKLDFYLAFLSGGAIVQTNYPDSVQMQISGTDLNQLLAEFSGSSVVFTRRGNLAGVANQGVRYLLYASELP